MLLTGISPSLSLSLSLLLTHTLSLSLSFSLSPQFITFQCLCVTPNKIMRIILTIHTTTTTTTTQGGNGLCCEYGEGSYLLHSKDGVLLASGGEYGAIDEHVFGIDPSVYLSGTTAADAVVADGEGGGDGGGGGGGQAYDGADGVVAVDGGADGAVVDGAMIPGDADAYVDDDVVGGGDAATTTAAATSATTTTTTTTPPAAAPTEEENDDDDNDVDQSTWWCGASWDWVTSNCDAAVPCPGGDAVDCPAGQACFASTPCTLSPTESPTDVPSEAPSDGPSSRPTGTPWGEEAFADFLYGDAEAGEDGDGGDGDGDGDALSSSGSSGNDDDAAEALAVNLTSVDELRHHFFCGISWTVAAVACSTYCPSGDKSDCPEGEECYANT
jgi:hypothetical protein